MRAVAVCVMCACVALAACFGSGTNACDSVECPSEKVCDGHGGCALREQLDACTSVADRTACSYPGVERAECEQGVCVAFGCGNGVVTSDEVCDDGNTQNGDGCSADCRSAETCGNGIVDVARGEQCDGGPRCRTDCTQELCGDGVLDAPLEACDNGSANALAPDACRPNCQLPRCGDGVVDGSEICDDGNTTSGDHCSANCKSREVCGDGVLNLEAGETCDCGTDPDNAPVNCHGFVNSDDPASPCRLDCSLRRCGDGVLEEPEQCEGSDLGSATCDQVGFYGGTLGCSSFCTFDTSACAGRCGDHVVDGPEQCDGTNLGSATCASLGLQGGTLACAGSCTFDTSHCLGACGDGRIEGAEQCDVHEFGGLTCASFGFYNGPLLCTSDCRIDAVRCSGFCGDGIVDGGHEDCESGQPPVSCSAINSNLSGDEVRCSSCHFDLTSCQGCGNGSCDGGESCDTCAQDCGACFCGNGQCNASAGETCESCSQDCGSCFCGNGTCDRTVGENCSSCAQECGCTCGDGVCTGNENCSSCPGDCGACFCGDGTCNGGETCASCSTDCGSCCGNGRCDNGEDCSSCSTDCGTCPFCGDGACNNGESCSSCSNDCGMCPFCGDSSCNNGEDCNSCPGDCGSC